MPLQPLWSERGENVQGVAHGFADQFQAVETANDGQDAGGVGALLTSGLETSPMPRNLSSRWSKRSLSEPPSSRSLLRNSQSTARHRSRHPQAPETARTLPVYYAGAYSVGGLAVGETLGKLHDGDQRQSPGRHRWLSTLGKQMSEVLVLKDRSQRVSHGHVGCALWEGSLGDTSGLLGTGSTERGCKHMANILREKLDFRCGG